MIEDISILLAEDESDLREYLSEYLHLFFKNIYLAKCGNEAYTIYKEQKPNIILSDINMPNLDGLSLISKIREDDKTTDIVIMSAYSDKEKLLQAIPLNLVSYMVKPIDSKELKEVLFKIVESIRAKTTLLHIEGSLYWDEQNRELLNENIAIELKNSETLTVELLIEKSNNIVSAKEIHNHIQNESSTKEFSKNAITSLIKRLRKKIPYEIIESIYGEGYSLKL